MKERFLFVFLSTAAFAGYAQPANRVYWVGPNIGASLTSPYWAATSGGAPGPYPATTNTQLIFDGGVTAGQSFFLNINTATGDFLCATNYTTVTLQKDPAGGLFDLQNSGFNVDSGSTLVFENTGTGVLLTSVAGAVSYNSTLAGDGVEGTRHSLHPNFLCRGMAEPLGICNSFSAHKITCCFRHVAHARHKGAY